MREFPALHHRKAGNSPKSWFYAAPAPHLCQRKTRLIFPGLTDHELCVDRHRPGNIEIIWRSLQDVLVNGLELVFRTVSFNPDRVCDRVIARFYAGVESQKTTQVQLSFGFDFNLLQLD